MMETQIMMMDVTQTVCLKFELYFEFCQESSCKFRDRMASYLVNYVGKFPRHFLTESTAGLGKHIPSIKEDGIHDWLRTGSHSVNKFPGNSLTESTKDEAIMSGQFQELP